MIDYKLDMQTDLERDHDMKMMEQAGLSLDENTKKVREEAGRRLVDNTEEDLLKYAESSLFTGRKGPEEVTEYLQSNPTMSEEDAKRYALEQEATDNMIVEEMMEDPGLVDRRADSLLPTNTDNVTTNLSLLDKHSSKFNETMEWTDTASGIAKRLIPFAEIGLRADVLPVDDINLDSTEFLQNRKDFMNYLVTNLSPEEFDKTMEQLVADAQERGVDKLAIADMFNTLTTSKTYEGIFTGVDLVGLGALGKTIKGGARAKGAKKALDRILKGAANTEDVNIALSDSALAVHKSDVTNVRTAIQPKLEEEHATQSAWKQLAARPDIERHPEIVKAVLEDFQKKVAVPKSPVDYSSFQLAPDDTGLYKIRATIGGGVDGMKPMTATAANRKAQRLQKLHPDAVINLKADGDNTFIEMSFDHSSRYEMGTIGGDIKDWDKNAFIKNTAGRINLPQYQNEINAIMQGQHTKLQSDMYELYNKSITALKPGQYKQLDAVFKEGLSTNIKGKWFTYNEVLEKTGDENVAAAYRAFKDMEDAAYEVEDLTVRQVLTNQGVKHFSNDKEEYLGKLVEGVSRPENTTFYDEITDTTYEVGDMSADLMNSLKKEGRKIVKVHTSSLADEDYAPAMYRFVTDASSKMGDVPRNIVRYQEGGRRIYSDGNLFLKMPVSYNVKGKEVFARPRTMYVSGNKAEMLEIADEINEIQHIIRTTDKADLTKALTNRSKFKHFTDVTDADSAKAYKFTGKGNAEVLEDGAAMTQYAGKEILDDADDIYSSSMMDLMVKQGRLRFGKPRERQEWLTDIGGRPATILDIKDSALKTVNNLIRNRTIVPYTDDMANDFVRRFNKVLDQDMLRTKSPLQILRDPNSIRKTKEEMHNPTLKSLVKGAENMQAHFRVQTDAMTEWDELVVRGMKKLANTLADNPTKEVLKRGSKMYRNLSTLRLDDLGRSLTYHTYLGFGNPVQFIKQGMGVLNVMALEPKNGAKALSLYKPLRVALMSNNKKTVEDIAKAVAKTKVMKVNEFSELVGMIRKTGGTYSEGLNVAVDSSAVLNAQGMKKASTFFANEGERLNLLVAQAASYLKNGGSDIHKWAGYSNDLYISQTKANQSVLQHGYKALPTQLVTQFTGYVTKLGEAMFNETFTASQRASLLASQVLFWGAAGTSGYDMFDNIYGWTESETASQLLNDGLITTAFKEAGIDFRQGPHFFELVEKVVSGEFVQPENMPVRGGVSLIANLMGDLENIFFPPVGEANMEYAAKYIATRSSLPSTFKGAARGYTAWVTGNYYNKQMQQVNFDRKLDKTDAVALALGFKPAEDGVLNRYYQMSRNRRDTAIELADSYKEVLYSALEAGTPEAWEEYKHMAKAFFALVREDHDGYMEEEVRRLISGMDLSTHKNKIEEILKQEYRAVGDEIVNAAYRTLGDE